MNNEDRILEILTQIQTDIVDLKAGQAKLEASQAKLEAGQAKLEASQAKLEAGQVQLLKDVSEIKTNIKYLWEDVERIGNRLDAHDVILNKKMM